MKIEIPNGQMEGIPLSYLTLSKMRVNNFPSAFDSYHPPEHKVYGCICISPQNKILLVKGRYGGIWSFPKGHRERFDKTCLDCALRELKEEAGISLNRDYIAYKKYKAGEYYIYNVPEEYRTFPQDTREIEEANWFTFEEMCEIRKNIDVSLFCQHIQKKILQTDSEVPATPPIEFTSPEIKPVVEVDPPLACL